jgi:hypothetical protein
VYGRPVTFSKDDFLFTDLSVETVKPLLLAGIAYARKRK